jgi:septum formation protein
MDAQGIYLASASPRRAALLQQIGVEYQVIAAEIGEDPLAGEAPEATVVRLAREKADNIARRTEAAPRPVLAADTLVVLAGEVMGKPRDTDQAQEMLAKLSGQTHRVLTGIALASEGVIQTRLNSSEVRFRSTTLQERRAYCSTGEPMGKAGAYAVQGKGAVFIERIDGSYSGVMGLPLQQTVELLSLTGQPAWLGAG